MAEGAEVDLKVRCILPLVGKLWGLQTVVIVEKLNVNRFDGCNRWIVGVERHLRACVIREATTNHQYRRP
jgi:hypothetical protein